MLHFFAILAAFLLLRSVLRQLDRIEAATAAPSQSALDQKVLCGYTPATPDEYVAALERHNRAATACLPPAPAALAHPPPERPPFSAQDARVCVVLGVLFVGLLMVCSYAGHGHFWPINLR